MVANLREGQLDNICFCLIFHFICRFVKNMRSTLLILVANTNGVLLGNSASAYLQLFDRRPSRIGTYSLISTILCFRPYKSYILCEDMILAMCHHHHMIIRWSSYIVISSKRTKDPTYATFLKRRGLKNTIYHILTQIYQNHQIHQIHKIHQNRQIHQNRRIHLNHQIHQS